MLALSSLMIVLDLFTFNEGVENHLMQQQCSCAEGQNLSQIIYVIMSHHTCKQREMSMKQMEDHMYSKLKSGLMLRVFLHTINC